MRSASPSHSGSSPRIRVATPTSGARIHLVPSSVFGPGKAASATTAIATYTVTTVAIPPNTDRGRSTPGRRASSARLATVSRPVKASIASGTENARACHVGCDPRDVPWVSACGENTKMNPSTTSRSCVNRSSAGTTMPSP